MRKPYDNEGYQRYLKYLAKYSDEIGAVRGKYKPMLKVLQEHYPEECSLTKQSSVRRKLLEIRTNENIVTKNKEYSLKEKLYDLLIKDKYTLDEMCEELGEPAHSIGNELESMRRSGYLIIDDGKKINIEKKLQIPEKQIIENKWVDGITHIRFGVVSDNHLTSKYQQLTHLNHAYDSFQEKAISKVFNAGDLCEGYKMRAGHENEIFVHGADDQRDYIIDVYPKREGVETYFISGNHDHSHIKRGGCNICTGIDDKRDDMHYLGMNEARIMITPNCSVDLVHPGGGSSYALSYKPQKYIESIQAGTKPNILIMGHYHKFVNLWHREVFAVLPGTTQAQTPWMRSKSLGARVGYSIIDLEVYKNGTIKHATCEWYPFFIMKEKDY